MFYKRIYNNAQWQTRCKPNFAKKNNLTKLLRCGQNRCLQQVRLLLFLFSFLITSGSVFGQKTVVPDTAFMLKRIQFFSSPENAGRLPGHAGYNNCSKYCADYFQELKMFPFAGSNWYQNFKIEYNEIKQNSCDIETKKGKTNLVPGTDYSVRGFSGSGKCSSEIIFCGYGINQASDGYNDYSGVDVKDKTVLIFKQNPSWQIKGISWEGSSIRFKVDVAKSMGAKAVIFVNAPSSGRTLPIGSMLDGTEEHIPDIPAIEVSTDKANEILAEKFVTLADLQSKIDNNQIPCPVITNTKAEINVQCSYIPDALTQNIIACFPGTDPVLKDEYVIISAHLDHVGFQGDSLYYPGANDNASGSSIVLEVASMWRKSKIKPARTVVFALFACEEHGIDGAKYFADHLPGDSSKVVAILNIDCAGHGDSLMIGGGKSAPGLWRTACDFAHNKPLSLRTWHGGGADAQPFFEKGIPSLYFATVNSYTYLHMPGDKVGTLNPLMLQMTSDIVFKTSVKVASKEYVREKISAL